eukprot:scaffold30.g4460.t1
MVSAFEGCPQAPRDAILGITEGFRADPDPRKINLGVGAYRTEEGKPLVLEVVKEAERRLLADPTQNHEYLNQAGIPEFCKLSARLAFGEGSPPLAEGRAVTVQGLSGTGSLRIGGEFLSRFYPRSKVVLLPSPTWANHKSIFERCGMEVRSYRYYKPETRGLDYEGFASGDLDADAFSVRLFARYAKNLGLYGERVGALTVVTLDAKVVPAVESQLKVTIRAINPPKHGAAIVATILGDPALFAQWRAELKGMADRIISMRAHLHAALQECGAPGSWDHVVKQIGGRAGGGMFSFTGLTPPQVENMTKHWHVWMTGDGRISMAGLSAAKCKYLAEAIKDSVERC